MGLGETRMRSLREALDLFFVPGHARIAANIIILVGPRAVLRRVNARRIRLRERIRCSEQNRSNHPACDDRAFDEPKFGHRFGLPCMVEPWYGLAPTPKLPAESSRPKITDELAEIHLPP